jgi:hypothetical protein
LLVFVEWIQVGIKLQENGMRNLVHDGSMQARCGKRFRQFYGLVPFK